jgi:TrmH family RNA methyltransferase
MISKSTVKYIQSLQHKKFRDEFNCFVAEGPKVVQGLLEQAKFRCMNIYGLKSWRQHSSSWLTKELEEKMLIIEDFELDKISGLTTANEVLAIFEKAEPVSPGVEGCLNLVLDDIQDPGNLGTIIRVADWFAVPNIFCSIHTVDMYNPKVVQSTMASLGNVNICYTDIKRLLADSPIKKYAAYLDGQPISEVSGIKEGFVIIGNESKGIADDILMLADAKITIPRQGHAESLNAAVATGILVYELTR